MDDWIWILIAVAVVVVVLAALFLAVRAGRRRRRTARLRARFGPEYETAVHRFGRTQGERHLEELLERHDTRRVRDVSHDERDAALRSLEAVQTSFVDSPVTAVRAADHLVFDVLRERGYPIETLDARASALAVEEPDLAHRYREAHSVLTAADTAADRTGGDGADVARLRDAFLTYRHLLRELVGAPDVSGRLVAGGQPESDAGLGSHAESAAGSDAESDAGAGSHSESPVPPEEGSWTSTRTDRTS